MDTIKQQNNIFRNSVTQHFAPLIDVFGFHGPIVEEGGGVVDISMSFWNHELVISIWIDKVGSFLELSFSRNLQQSLDKVECRPDESYLGISDILDLIGADGRIRERQRLRNANIDVEVAWCYKQLQIVLPILTEYYSDILRKVRSNR